MGFLASLVLLIQGWLVVVVTSPDPAATAHRDWIQFHRTGERVVEGAFDEIYPGSFVDDGRPDFDDGFYFLYPPHVAWATVPFGLLTPWSAYIALVLVVAAATVLAALACTWALGMKGEYRLFTVLGTMASAPWNGAVLLGHLSATLLMSPSLALVAWRRGSSFWCGAALGLLLSKPNWGLPMLLFLAAGRRWRMLAGALSTSVAFLLVSIPFGTEVMLEWVRTMVGYRGLITDATLPWRQATLFASIQSLLGRPGSDTMVEAIWLSLSGVLFVAAAGLWYRRASIDETFPRLLGIALLAVVATTPYAHFYDVLLTLPAALLLWGGQNTWTSPKLLRLARTLFVLTWIWMHFQFLLWMELVPSLTGIGFSAWLAVELVDLARGIGGTSKSVTFPARVHAPGDSLAEA